MIHSFACADTERLFRDGVCPKFLEQCESVARRKLDMIEAAHVLNDLRSPPGNRLEALSGNRSGQHSIRVNDQYRVCFVWNDGAHDVEIVDYH